MTIDDKIRYKKLQYDINRETSKRSALWSGKIDKYKYPIVLIKDGWWNNLNLLISL